jgi:hypothetical protein
MNMGQSVVKAAASSFVIPREVLAKELVAMRTCCLAATSLRLLAVLVMYIVQGLPVLVTGALNPEQNRVLVAFLAKWWSQTVVPPSPGFATIT